MEKHLNRDTFQELAAEKQIDLDYELSKGFAARLIRRKAKQLVGKANITISDRPELEQQLKIRLLRRLSKFDPTKRHWNVFVTMVVERMVATILESRRAKKCEHGQNITSLSVNVQDEDGESVELARMVKPQHQDAITGRATVASEEAFELAHDVTAVLTTLPDDLRELCEQLKHKTLTEIAQDMNVPRSTLADKIYKLRQIFERAGLKSFLEILP